MALRQYQWTASALALVGAAALSGFTAHAQFRRPREDGRLGTIFVIAMENHNWTQPASQTSPQAIFMNVNAPFINSLVNGTSGISDQVSYATNYLNSGVGVHPSEPNYIWAEAGTNFGISNDDDPCADNPKNQQDTNQHLTAFLMRKHVSWKSYQEDTDVDLSTNLVVPTAQWTVPLVSHSGTFSAPGSFNSYNYSNQFNYAAKHNPMVFFKDTAGGCDTSASNPMRVNYAPLQQLAVDLQNDRVADYNWITPDQYNEQHSNLKNGYGGPAGTPNPSDPSEVAEGDNFLARVVPLILSSAAYQDHGAILLWWDESEGGDDPSRTLPFIVISKDVHPNVGGLPYKSSVEYSHSSTLRTMQEVFDVDPDDGFEFLGGALTATDLSALFKTGVVRQR